jgi:cholesterol transport system auxiliary component
MKKRHRGLDLIGLKILALVGAVFSLAACSLGPVQTPPVGQYFLQAPPVLVQRAPLLQRSILIATIQSAPGYETNAMRYVMTPYQLESFTTHAWVSPPAQLWQPLLEAALQQSGIGMIVHTPIPVQTHYRLDIRLDHFEQNFQKPQSVFLMQASVMVQNVYTGHLMGAKTFRVSVPAQTNTPYAGVLAANTAVVQMDREIVSYVVNQLSVSR